MKNLVIVCVVGLFTISCLAQEQKVTVVPFLVKGIVKPVVELPNVSDSFINEILLGCGMNHQTVKSKRIEIPYKIYTLKEEKENWFSMNQVYNTITTKIPGIQIEDRGLTDAPKIRIRNSEDVVIMVDGIRYDASILNTINPLDIETIEVANNPAAQTYYQGNRRN